MTMRWHNDSTRPEPQPAPTNDHKQMIRTDKRTCSVHGTPTYMSVWSIGDTPYFSYLCEICDDIWLTQTVSA